MEDREKDPSTSFCNGSSNTTREKLQIVGTRISGRIMRAGFSDSFSTHDLTSLKVEDNEEEEEKEEEDSIRERKSNKLMDHSPREVVEDGRIVRIEIDTSGGSIASTSGSEGTSQSLIDKSSMPIKIRDFFRVFKKVPKTTGRAQNPASASKKSGLVSLPKLTRRKSKRIREAMVPTPNSTLESELSYFKSCWTNFSLADLHAATNNFSRENLIGEGGYAEVYKGQLEDGQHVAIKRLTRGSQEEMTMDFLSELGIIVHVDHPNIAKLIGYGVEGGMHLVLQLSHHGSLSSILHGEKEKLEWRMRFKIAVGTAEGLLYLHEGCHRRIIHKDIKPSNILLTQDFEPQISDFGLAKWLPDQWTHHTVSKVEGTFGYLPPEFFMHGIVDEKTDVYAFGVLLLELITGRQALDNSQQSLVMWAKPLLMKKSIEKLVDPTLGDAYDNEQMDRMVLIASLCIHQTSMQRPQMSQVVQILKGDKRTLGEVKQQQSQKSKLQRTYSEELFDANEYNSTKYLNELNRHMEIVLGNIES